MLMISVFATLAHRWRSYGFDLRGYDCGGAEITSIIVDKCPMGDWSAVSAAGVDATYCESPAAAQTV